MVLKNLMKNSITNTFKLCSQKKGKSNLAKKVLCDYVVSSFKQKDNKNFIKIFENLLTNISLPFTISGRIDMRKYKYRTYNKSVSSTIVDIIKKTNINKERRPFGIYLEDNINKLLNSLNININKESVGSLNNIKSINDKYTSLNQVINLQNNFEKKTLIKNYFKKFFHRVNNNKSLCKYDYIL